MFSNLILHHLCLNPTGGRIQVMTVWCFIAQSLITTPPLSRHTNVFMLNQTKTRNHQSKRDTVYTTYCLVIVFRAQLFKANDVVSWRFVKIYIEYYADMLKFFAEKMWVAFAVQKLLTFFQQKISVYCVLNLLKQLTKWPLMSSLS